MRDTVMARGHTEELGETRTPGGARDLLRGLAWILSTNPAANAFSATSVQRDRAASNDESFVFINPTRWNGFRFWAEALGFAAPALVASDYHGGMIADSSRAVWAAVKQTASPGQDVSAGVAIADLKERLPVLPGGAVSVALGFPALPDTEVDAATSFALLALEESGLLELRSLSDATGAVQFAQLDPSEPSRLVTHLVVRGR